MIKGFIRLLEPLGMDIWLFDDRKVHYWRWESVLLVPVTSECQNGNPECVKIIHQFY